MQDALDDGGVRLGEQRRRERGEAVPQFAGLAGLPGAPGADESGELAGAQVGGGENAARGAERKEWGRDTSSPASTAKSAGRPAISRTVSWSGRFPALATTILLWASAFPAIRVAVDGLGVQGLSLLRLAVACAALAAAGKLLKVRRPQRRDLPRIALCGATGMSAYQIFLNWGELHVPAGTASLLIKAAPVVSVLLATSFLGERLTFTIVIGSIVAIGGAAVIAFGGGSAQFSASAVIVLAAGIAQGIYHFATKPLLQRYTGLEVACYAMWTGTLFLLPLAPAAVRDLTVAPVPAILTTVYLGLLPSALGFVTWGYAVARYTLAQATAALYLVPPVTMAIAFVWLGEIPGATALLGGLVSTAGVILINLPREHGNQRVPESARTGVRD